MESASPSPTSRMRTRKGSGKQVSRTGGTSSKSAAAPDPAEVGVDGEGARSPSRDSVEQSSTEDGPRDPRLRSSGSPRTPTTEEATAEQHRMQAVPGAGAEAVPPSASGTDDRNGPEAVPPQVETPQDGGAGAEPTPGATLSPAQQRVVLGAYQGLLVNGQEDVQKNVNSLVRSTRSFN